MARFDISTYVDVQTRITRFWTEYPDGAINTRLMGPPDDFERCRYEASVYKHRDDMRASAVGYAFELYDPDPQSRGPNRTSHEENCETSAIGRALANMGYATTREDRPSAQEMRKVANGTKDTTPPPNAPPRAPQGQDGQPTGGASEAQIRAMFAIGGKLFGSSGRELEDALHALAEALYNADALHDLTAGRGGTASAMIDYLQKQNGPADAMAVVREHAAHATGQTDLSGMDKVAAQVDRWTV